MKHINTLLLAFTVFMASCAHTTPPAAPESARTPAAAAPPVTILDPPSKFPVKVPSEGEHFDVVVVGAGLAGLSAAVYLTDAGKKVLMLEKENHLGGLAAWAEGRSHIRYDRGAAYWTSAYEEEEAILKHIKLGDFSEKFPIPDPIDSYYGDGVFYADIWSPATVAKLPASFALFKFELERADEDKKIPNQPFEDFTLYGGNPVLDSMSAREWIEKMPAALEARLPALHAALADGSLSKKDRAHIGKVIKEGETILTRFKKELPTLKGPTGMEATMQLLDLYCRSALGNVADTVSAMAFANFYISEIVTRYTTPKGTGAAAGNMVDMLRGREAHFQASTNSPVTAIHDGAESVQISFEHGGTSHFVQADYVVFAAQVNQAPKLIDGFKERAPEQAELMSSLGYSHYSVHTLEVKGHPYRAAYDTWVSAKDASPEDFTDVILGLWVDHTMLGYKGYRDFKNDPPKPDAIMTIYHPLSQKWMKREYSEEEAKDLARFAADRMERIFSGLPADLYRGPLVIKTIQTSRWPYSVHIAEPGHYTKKAAILRKPFGRVHFANNNIGTPAFEEALFRGHCAADNVLKRFNPKFKREKWSRCPMDVQ